ncbi:hypothetical protein JM83_2935 [Gillisia sp. Hel_I_86]|uniref:hypothetical protein n=1 Tax=Gillisia sp. Hel_I_86 TaxID=1249981 RepID=UPI001199D281|nr:hypothetical protein [Gillisia sp. Hel_I_86]TVZ27866.1 hypothetical protein JM83_2935 [Gillisia sp. Hel_I_86]
MKNLFFALAFMLTGTFSFASNEVKESNAVVEQDTEITTISTQVKCYARVVGVSGTIYIIEIACPND